MKATFKNLDMLLTNNRSFGWTSENSEPISELSYVDAKRFIGVIPMPMPDMSLEKNGCISFSWTYDNAYMIITFDGNGIILFKYKTPQEEKCGSIQFSFPLPTPSVEKLFDMIYKVMKYENRRNN